MQASAAMASAGPIGPVGPPGPRGLGLAIIDANGTYVGLPYRDSTASIGYTGVVRDVNGNAVLLQVHAKGIEAVGVTVFHYESNDCTGTPLIAVDWPRGVRQAFSTSPAGPFFYGTGPAVERTVRSWSVSDANQTECLSGWTSLPPDRCCQARTFDGEYAHAAMFEATFESPFRVTILGGEPLE